MVLNVTETIRLIRDGEKGVRGYGGGGRGRLYTYRYTVTTRMTPALRCTATRAILMFYNCEGQSHKTMSTDYNFWRERRAEVDSNRGPSAFQPNALPLGQTGSLLVRDGNIYIYNLFTCQYLSRRCMGATIFCLVLLNVLGCRLKYQGQAETNAWAWFTIALRPRKP